MTPVCRIEGCARPVCAQNLCKTCYYRLLRRGEIVARVPTPRKKHRLSNIDPEAMRADCAHCGRVKVNRRGKGSNQWRCSVDANHRSKLRKREMRKPRKEMLKAHCEICRRSPPEVRLCWDHCHVSGRFRGTLCNLCNQGIGLFKDSPEILAAAIRYLARPANEG